MNRYKRLPAALAALLAAGCAGYPTAGLAPGAPEAQVRQAMGPPALELPEPGGGRELVYPHGPLGTETFMAHLDTAGALRGVEQVLTDEHFQAIQPGQTQDEVLRRLGPPAEKMPFPRSSTIAWTWRYMDGWGYTSDFSVTFAANGLVVDKIAVRLQRRGDR